MLQSQLRSIYGPDYEKRVAEVIDIYKYLSIYLLRPKEESSTHQPTTPYHTTPLGGGRRGGERGGQGGKGAHGPDAGPAGGGAGGRRRRRRRGAAAAEWAGGWVGVVLFVCLVGWF